MEEESSHIRQKQPGKYRAVHHEDADNDDDDDDEREEEHADDSDDSDGGYMSDVAYGLKYLLGFGIFLWWLPIWGPMIAGYIGGKKAGSPGRGFVAAFIPSSVFVILIWGSYLGWIPIDFQTILDIPETTRRWLEARNLTGMPFLDMLLETLTVAASRDISPFGVLILFAIIGGALADEKEKVITATIRKEIVMEEVGVPKSIASHISGKDEESHENHRSGEYAGSWMVRSRAEESLTGRMLQASKKIKGKKKAELIETASKKSAGKGNGKGALKYFANPYTHVTVLPRIRARLVEDGEFGMEHHFESGESLSAADAEVGDGKEKKVSSVADERGIEHHSTRKTKGGFFSSFLSRDTRSKPVKDIAEKEDVTTDEDDFGSEFGSSWEEPASEAKKVKPSFVSRLEEEEKEEEVARFYEKEMKSRGEKKTKIKSLPKDKIASHLMGVKEREAMRLIEQEWKKG